MKAILSHSTALPAILCLAGLASARQCQNLTVELPLEARNAVFNLTAPTDEIDITNFVLGYTRNGHNLTAESLTGYTTINSTYRIAATYCEPDAGPPRTVQLLTHGIAFDRTYWDLAHNGHNYSYVARAVDGAGYSTLAWDRLGVARSQRGDPLAEIQSALEIAALHALTTRLRDGTLNLTAAAAAGGPPNPRAFDRVVHVGHSFGSIQSYSLAVLHPGASDGLVLTGFTQEGAFLPYFGFASNFRAAAADADAADADTTTTTDCGCCGEDDDGAEDADYPAGYLALGDARALQANFFASSGGGGRGRGPSFDPALLRAAFASATPVAVGELLTLGAQTGEVNPFAGPVLVVTGDRDMPFCGGDCGATGDAGLPSYLELTRPFFPNASTFEAVVVGDSGHGLNLEYSHPFTYSTILDFITENVGK